VLEAVLATKNKAPGPDGMCARLIKIILPIINDELNRLFTHHLQHGLPAEMKEGSKGFSQKHNNQHETPPNTDRFP
jgi:hypothetical protein